MSLPTVGGLTDGCEDSLLVGLENRQPVVNVGGVGVSSPLFKSGLEQPVVNVG